jgi:hypothetical protein
MTKHSLTDVDPTLARQLQQCLEQPPGLNVERGQVLYNIEHCFAEPIGQVISTFRVQVVAPLEPEMETCWAEGVLYRGVIPLGFTEKRHQFLGIYEIAGYTLKIQERSEGILIQ